VRFRSFRTRLLFFFVGLLCLVQASTFLLVDLFNSRNALVQVDAALHDGLRDFSRLLDERSDSLLVAAYLLGSDYAFKEVFAARDHATLISAMENHAFRVYADAMFIVTPMGKVIADTLHPDRLQAPNPWPELLADAKADADWVAKGLAIVDGTPYQMAVVPLEMPDLVGWIFTGFRINDRFVEDVGFNDLSILHREPGGNWNTLGSTLPDSAAVDLPEQLAHLEQTPDKVVDLRLGETDYVSLVAPLLQRDEHRVVAVLQRTLAEQLQPYQAWRWVHWIVFTAGLLLSTILAMLIARSSTRPLVALAQRAHAIQEGCQVQPVEVDGRDEIAALAQSFNEMAQGLAEKEQIRSLLGKVVSSVVADELLRSKIELGGEERIATVLFADLRNFTSFCERRRPAEILALLNTCFTEITRVIEEHGGVVDKYLGDGVMALFGAPLRHPDDPPRAVATALGIQRAVFRLNQRFGAEGLPSLDIGIGLNTAVVVAGNMGSETRHNYTVIGDGVNLAARLEALTKHYGVPVIASQSTRDAAPEFAFLELDRVRVKGKTEVVSIYQPLGLQTDLDEVTRARLSCHQEALGLFRHRDWQVARELFADCCRLAGGKCPVAQMYQARIDQYLVDPPTAGYDIYELTD
jgi:adenylate cyclase